MASVRNPKKGKSLAGGYAAEARKEAYHKGQYPRKGMVTAKGQTHRGTQPLKA